MLDRELSCHPSALWKLGLPGVQSVTWWSKGVCFRLLYCTDVEGLYILLGGAFRKQWSVLIAIKFFPFQKWTAVLNASLHPVLLLFKVPVCFLDSFCGIILLLCEESFKVSVYHLNQSEHFLNCSTELIVICDNDALQLVFFMVKFLNIWLVFVDWAAAPGELLDWKGQWSWGVERKEGRTFSRCFVCSAKASWKQEPS